MTVVDLYPQAAAAILDLSGPDLELVRRSIGSSRKATADALDRLLVAAIAGGDSESLRTTRSELRALELLEKRATETLRRMHRRRAP